MTASRRDLRTAASSPRPRTGSTAALLVGRYGWVQFALEDVTPAELRALVEESYRLVAPKKRRA